MHGGLCTIQHANNTCLMQALLAVPVDEAPSEDSRSGSSALHLLLRHLVSSSWRAASRFCNRSTYDQHMYSIPASCLFWHQMSCSFAFATQHGTLTLRLFCRTATYGAVLLQPPAGLKISKRDAAGVVSQPVPAVPGHWQIM
jgi:hypothetical protein